MKLYSEDWKPRKRLNRASKVKTGFEDKTSGVPKQRNAFQLAKLLKIAAYICGPVYCSREYIRFTTDFFSFFFSLVKKTLPAIFERARTRANDFLFFRRRKEIIKKNY